MPKKDKDKKQSPAAKKAEAVDPLPQVWLPDQVQFVVATNLTVGGAAEETKFFVVNPYP